MANTPIQSVKVKVKVKVKAHIWQPQNPIKFAAYTTLGYQKS
jgi:hypothetical protein